MMSLENIFENIQYYLQVIPIDNFDVFIIQGFEFENNILYFPEETLN